MSIATEIQRLRQAKADIKTAIENKGVIVGDGTIDIYATKIGEISGGGDYSQGYADGSFWWQRVKNFARIFYKAEFPENTELVLDVSNEWRLQETSEDNRYYDLTYAFSSCKGLKSIKIVANEKHPIVIQYAFSGGTGVEIVDLSDCPLIKDMRSAFQYNHNLKEIVGELDCSYLISNGINNNSFITTSKLETVRFKANTISLSISFADSSKLTDESIDSIIGGLKSAETTQTLTFHADIGAKLTDTQKASITEKNWTLAY